jgi:predicted nucleotidyltransferase
LADRERKAEKGCVNVENGVKLAKQHRKECEKGNGVPDKGILGSTLRYDGQAATA